MARITKAGLRLLMGKNRKTMNNPKLQNIPTMNDTILKIKTQELLNQGKPDEALDILFNAYLEDHPNAKNLEMCREKVNFKLKNEFQENTGETREQSKLLLYGFMTVIGQTEGDTAFNLILLLLHLVHKGHNESLREAIEIIKLERASNNLNVAV